VKATLSTTFEKKKAQVFFFPCFLFPSALKSFGFSSDGLACQLGENIR
jgi:hypothetical protein